MTTEMTKPEVNASLKTRQPEDLIRTLNKKLAAGPFLPGKAPQVERITKIHRAGAFSVKFRFWNGATGKGEMIAEGQYWVVCYGPATVHVAA